LTPALLGQALIIRPAEEIRMLRKIRRLWFGGVTALAVAAAALGALTLPASPARAQEWFGVQVGPFGFGFGEPYYYHYYYPYGYRWGYPY
jgi:hypothetical protein